MHKSSQTGLKAELVEASLDSCEVVRTQAHLDFYFKSALVSYGGDRNRQLFVKRSLISGAGE